MAHTPVIEIEDVLIATVQEDLHDRDALVLQEDLIEALERSGARAVLLDISAVDTVDSFLGRLLNDIAVGTRLMGAHTVVVGVQPAVAITLVELGLELRGIRVALNAKKGIKLVRRLLKGESYRGR